MLPTAHSPRWHVTNWGVLPLWHQLWGLRSDPGLAFTMTLSEHSWLTALHRTAILIITAWQHSNTQNFPATTTFIVHLSLHSGQGMAGTMVLSTQCCLGDFGRGKEVTWDHVDPAHSYKLTVIAGWDQSQGPGQTSTDGFLMRSLGFLTLRHNFRCEH